MPILFVAGEKINCDLVIFDLDGTLIDEIPRFRSLAQSRVRALRGMVDEKAVESWARASGVNLETWEVDEDGPLVRAPRRDVLIVASVSWLYGLGAPEDFQAMFLHLEAGRRVERDHVLRLMARDHIEIAPLAFMRGRTLNDAFIILDEAQNTTSEQMKMFLTRLGFNSKAVITGDITQIDLPQGMKSGLVEASQLLHDIDEIGFVYFSEDDVVRHKVVAKIIRAYEKGGR